MDGLSITNGYDQFLRRGALALLQPNRPLVQQSFGYDAASRLQTASDGVNVAAYTYLANSPLVSQIFFTNGNALRMTTTKSYDFLNRLTQISNTPSGSSAISFSYGYNSANQRTAITNADSSNWRYQYDPLGQVTSGKKYFSDNVPVAGQQFQYAFDDIGNRLSAASGGDQWGANLRYQFYSANNLNQYTSRRVPPQADVVGTANSSATVTVNSTPTYRHGTYYRAELPLDNSAGPVWQSITNIAVLHNGSSPDISTNLNGNVFLPQTPESFAYDADGNLTQDGRWNYGWDAENRLIAMTNATATGPQQVLRFAYDAKGRRIQKQVWGNSTGTGSPTNDICFAYDGWNLIAVLSPQSSVLQSFLWGLDLSGSPQGAGGVGGLLAVWDSSTLNAQPSTHFVAFDGNGNVAALANAADGNTTAQYDYSPFGEPLRATGPMAGANLFRFSTKPQEPETDLLYYGHRYYNSSTGRWIKRDPIDEKGGMNLYSLARNSPVNAVDKLGLCCKCVSVEAGTISESPMPQWESAGVLSISFEVPWKVTVKGDIAKCKCRYTDNGDMKARLANEKGETADLNVNWPSIGYEPKAGCLYEMDRPGVHGLGPLSSTGSVTWTITVNLTMTMVCYDEGSEEPGASGSASINGVWNGAFSW